MAAQNHHNGWSDRLPVVQMRFARPTNDLERITQFYCEGLGLAEVGRFEDHQGYSGVMLGLPDRGYHLEFTQKDGESLDDIPHSDDLIVFYIPDRQAIGRLVLKLTAMGYHPVPPDNPYWQNKSVGSICVSRS